MQPKAFFYYFLAFITSLALVFSMASPVMGASETSGASKLSLPSNLAGLLEAAQSTGSVRVIVMFNLPFQTEGKLAGGPAGIDQRVTIEQTQAGLLSRLSGYAPALVKRFSTIPGMALSVDADGLAQLAADGAIANVEPDRLAVTDLAESVPLIGAAVAQASGFTGDGQVVAVLDTGVDKNHPFLSGRVVEEACYSTTDSGYSSTSICPGRVSQSTAPDSALPYATGVCQFSKCDHGTHVAGIIAGNATSVYNHNGVAPGARLIAIQVFSWFSSCQCAQSFTSDQILGLERVYALRTKYAIAAVNMSLGGSDKYDGQSTCDLDYSIEKAAIDKLRSVGIATIIAAGNSSSYSYGLSAPACISSAISVGSIGDGSGQAATDTVCPFSNSASYLSFLAPGDEIYSSIPGNSYQSMRGTSMATPHVAGAWALVKSRYPGFTVSQVAALLTYNGKPITDPRNGVTIPRIKLDQILGVTFSVSGQVKLGGGGLAGVTLIDGNGHAATTDASGNYSITGLPAGAFTITPSRSDYTFTPINQSVTVGPSLTGVNFSATQIAFTISGQVTTGGSGLAGVTVSNGAGLIATTGVDGSYTFHNLLPGAYILTPTKAEYTFIPPTLSLSLGADQSGESFTAAPVLHTIHGQVTLGGSGLAGVALSDGAGHSALTDASGNYTLNGLPAGTYTITPSNSAYTFSPVNSAVQLGPDQSGIIFAAVPLVYFYFPLVQYRATP